MRTDKSKNTGSRIGRRGFLKAALAVGMAPAFIPSSLFGRQAPSNRVNLAFIGVGSHGTRMNLQSFLKYEDCLAVAVCDAWEPKMEEAAAMVDETYGRKGCRRETDFRELIADPSVDAVVISTPDHWHVPMSLRALSAGKHVFCEKPTMTIAEGRELIDAVRASGKIFQTGLEDRSLARFHKLVEWVRNGAIGDLYHMDVTLPPGHSFPWEPKSTVPDGLNWKLWRGPAPERAYTESTTEPLVWRNIRDYSTGIITDWGTHLVDTAQLAASESFDSAIEVKGWAKPLEGKLLTDIPTTYELHYRYPNGVTMKLDTASSGDFRGATARMRFLGSKGWLGINGFGGPFEASDESILRTRYEPENSKHFPLPPREHRNFLDCIREGGTPTYDVETLQKLCVTLHMGVIAADLGRPLRWDPKRNRFRDDSAANRRQYRELNTDWESA